MLGSHGVKSSANPLNHLLPIAPSDHPKLNTWATTSRTDQSSQRLPHPLLVAELLLQIQEVFSLGDGKVHDGGRHRAIMQERGLAGM